MKPVLRINNKSIFRVNTNFYPRELVLETFGKGEMMDEYLLYELDMSESEIFARFNKMLEELL